MRDVTDNKSVEFFETQFQRQVRERDYALNPFETLALDYLTGTVLDLGCGLGNLSLEAGRRGHRILAVDASPAAIARINLEYPVIALRELSCPRRNAQGILDADRREATSQALAAC